MNLQTTPKIVAEAHYEAVFDCKPIAESGFDLMQVHPLGVMEVTGTIPIPFGVESDDWTNYALMELDEYFQAEPRKLTIGCWRVSPPA